MGLVKDLPSIDECSGRDGVYRLHTPTVSEVVVWMSLASLQNPSGVLKRLKAVGNVGILVILVMSRSDWQEHNDLVLDFEDAFGELRSHKYRRKVTMRETPEAAWALIADERAWYKERKMVASGEGW